MSKSLPLYTQLAVDHGARICRGFSPTDQLCLHNHKRGAAFQINGELVVHWDRVNPTRVGIRRFLFLIAYAKLHKVEEPWRRLYLALRETIRHAEKAGLRLPAAMYEEDRTRLKYMLLYVPTTIPGREEAMAWALGK